MPVFDNDDLLDLAGNFWTDVIKDDTYKQVVLARNIIEKQTDQIAKEIEQCLSLKTTPIYRKIFFQRLDETRKLPNGTISIALITDKINDPSLILTEDVDYTIEDNKLVFNTEVQEPILWAHNVLYDDNLLYDCYGSLYGVKAKSSEDYRQLLLILHKVILNGMTRSDLDKLVVLFGNSDDLQDIDLIALLQRFAPAHIKLEITVE